MQDELQVLAMRFPDHQVAREMLEPAAQDFVSDAFLAVMESPSPEKRTLLGRLIAQRLYAKTESSNELYLRQAEMLTRRMNTSHLWVAATVYLVHNAPLPQGYKRDDVYGWMDRNLWPVFSVVCKNVPTYDELDYLSSLGVVTYDRSDRSDNLSLSSHAPSLEQRLLHASNEHFEQFAVVRRGRFYDRAVELDEGKFSKEHGQELISLAPYALTVPGLRIAETMVTQIHEELVAPTVFDGGLPSFEVVVYGLG
ncbi:MAG TPA: hypothetical protein VMF11_08395 [Candidatus Baltobacteraceae bacterium]|nr:hypothetical protein [Candidatus Baltobacteraceae bacterium]